jgi:hypothetical protein
MASRPARVARGTGAAAAATAAAAVSHGIAGGDISLIAVIVAMLFSTTICIPLVGRRLSVPRLAAAVVVSQLGFHLLFSSLGSTEVVWRASADHHGVAMSADVAAAPAPAHAGMWLGHAIAALVTTVLLARGEAAARDLISQVLHVPIWRLVAPVAIPVERSRAAVVRVVRPRILVVLTSALSYRGPPAIRFA